MPQTRVGAWEILLIAEDVIEGNDTAAEEEEADEERMEVSPKSVVAC